VTAASRPYGKFYDFHSVSLETFGSTLVYRTIILPVVLYECENWSLTLRE
jgi:hypothetical protein